MTSGGIDTKLRDYRDRLAAVDVVGIYASDRQCDVSSEEDWEDFETVAKQIDWDLERRLSGSDAYTDAVSAH